MDGNYVAEYSNEILFSPCLCVYRGTDVQQSCEEDGHIGSASARGKTASGCGDVAVLELEGLGSFSLDRRGVWT